MTDQTPDDSVPDESPEVPDVPEVPEVPDAPNAPDVPEVPEVPDAPNAPDVPEVPGSSAAPGVPLAADAPTLPEAGAEAPGAPAVAIAIDPAAAVGAVPPQKKSLPGWGWALIIGGTLFVVGIVITVILAIVLLNFALSEDEDDGCAVPGTCRHEPTPATTAPPVAEPDEPVSLEGQISLDAIADFGGPPLWGVPFDSTWEILVFDQDGINSFRNNDNGCLFVTSQRQTAVSSASASDRQPSEQAMKDELAGLASSTATLVELDSGVAGVAVSSASSGSSLEFLTSTQQQTVASGDVRVVELLVRAMPASGSAMSTLVMCDADVYNAGESPFEDLITQITVTPSF